MVPMNARARRLEVEKKLQKLRDFADNFSENKIEMHDTEVGIITAGMSYNYAKDIFPDYSYLKLGMVYPLPEKLIRTFASKVKKLYVIEELDPFIEEQVKAMGIEVTGKEIFPYTNEFDPGVIESSLKGEKTASIETCRCHDSPKTAESLSWLSTQRAILRSRKVESLCRRRYRLLHVSVHETSGRAFIHVFVWEPVSAWPMV